MLDEDIERDVLGKGVFLSEEEEDLLKILHDWLLEKVSVMETYSLGLNVNRLTKIATCKCSFCVVFLSWCCGLTRVDPLTVFVMQLHLAALSTMYSSIIE